MQPPSVCGATPPAYAVIMATTSVLWRNLCRLANVDPGMRGALDAVHAAVGRSVGRGTIQRITEGTQPRLTSLTKIARALGVETADLLSETLSVRESYNVNSSLAHAVSQRAPIVLPQELIWEDLVRETIQGQFILAIKGDSLAPDFLPGQKAIWQAGCTARPGQPVLLRLPDESFELRIFEGRGATWAGISPRPGHRTITPEADGAEIVARLKYLDLD